MAKKQKKKDPYAICTAQKKKSGMGHDAWKRCVQHVQQKESVMKFYDRVLSILEASAKKKKKVLTTDKDEDEAELDFGDTMESKKRKKKDLDEYDDEKDDDDDSTMKKMAKDKEDAGFGPLDDKDKAAIQRGVDTAREKEAARKAALNASKKREMKEGSRPHKPHKGSAAHEDPRARFGGPEGTMDTGPRPEPPDDDGNGDGDDKPKKTEAKKGKKKDDKWIQKAVDPDHEGFCTPMTKKTCTPKRKALAKTFKKMGKKKDAATKAKDEK